MRNLREDNRNRIHDVRTIRSSDYGESSTFIKDTQLLEKAILTKLQEKPVNSDNLVAILTDQETALIQRLTPHWQYKAILRIIRRMRLHLTRKNPDTPQYPLPGFEDMGERVRINGHEKRFAALTHELAIAHVRELEGNVKANSTRIARMHELISMMEPYSRTDPNITVREVCEREASLI